VVADAPIPSRSNRDLYYSIRAKGHVPRYIQISRLSIKLDNGDVSVISGEGKVNIDGVFLRSLGFLIDVEQFFHRVSVLRILEESGSRVVNSVDGLLKTRNKIETLAILARNKIPVPSTVSTESLLVAYNAAKSMGQVVIKPVQGSRGFGSVMVKDPDVAFQVARSLLVVKKPIYVQRYIEKPNRDIRVMVINGEVFGCMYRIVSDGRWKTNIAQGAYGKPCGNVDEELRELSIKATEALGLTYAGVDIGEGPEGYVVFEVNGSPDWQELASVTMNNPAPRLVEVMESLIKR